MEEDYDIDVAEMLATEDEGQLKGVENNAESRFIDYSFATPYESFIADIETILRTWQHQQVQSDTVPPKRNSFDALPTAQPLYMELDYLDVKYALIFYSNKRHLNQYMPSNTGKLQQQSITRVVMYTRQVSMCYNLPKFVLLTALGGTGMNKQRHIDKAIQSALYMSIDSSCIEVPAFYYCGMKRKRGSNLNDGSEVLNPSSVVTTVGYGITPIEVKMPVTDAHTSQNESEDYELVVIGNIVSHYSTELYSNVSPNHTAGVNGSTGVDCNDLYYCDGLWDFFKEKLFEYSMHAISLPDRDSTHQYVNVNLGRGLDEARPTLLEPIVKVVETFSYCTSISNEENSSNENSNYFKRLLVLYNDKQSVADGDMEVEATEDGAGVLSPEPMYGDAKLDVATSPVNSGISQYENNAEYLSILQLFNNYCKSDNASGNIFGGVAMGNNYRNFKWLKDIVITIEYSNVAPNGDGNENPAPHTPTNKYSPTHASTLADVGSAQTVVDNAYYTNLLPSKQAPEAWNISTVFYNPESNRHAQRSTSSPAPGGASTSVLGDGLRKLMALYLFGKSAGRAQGGVTNCKSLLELPIDLNYLDGVCDVLSYVTKQTVMGLCNAASNEQTASRAKTHSQAAVAGAYPPLDIPRGNLNGTVGGYDRLSLPTGEPNSSDKIGVNSGVAGRYTYSHPLLGKIFSKKQAPTTSEDGDSVKRVFDELQAKLHEFDRASGNNSTPTDLLPLYHFLSLCSAQITECDSIFDMCTLWYEHIARSQLRGVNWEQGQVINNMNITKDIDDKCFGHGDIRNTCNIMQCYNKSIPNFETMLGYEGEKLNVDSNGSLHGYATALLWDDVVKKHSGKETKFCLPDLSQSLLCQKLQMLQMCIICNDEAPFVSTETANQDLNTKSVCINPPKLLRRLPYTSDNTAYYYHLLTKSKSVVYPEDWKAAIKEQIAQVVREEEGSQSTARVQYASLASLETPECTNTGTELGMDGPQSSSADVAKTDRNPSHSALLRYSIRVPHILADIRCFREENTSATFEQFLIWYKSGPNLDGVNESDPGLECWFEQVLRDIWNLVNVNTQGAAAGSCNGESLPALPACDMKPLFRVEQEGEKALGYLENVPLTTLAVECICNKLVSTYVCICVQLTQSRHRHALRSTLALLCDNIVQVLPLLQQEEYVDSSVYNAKLTRDRAATNASYVSTMSVNSLEESVFSEGESVFSAEDTFSRPTSPPIGSGEINQRILILLDAICNLVDVLVSYDEKLTELECILPNSPRLVELLCNLPQYSAGGGDGSHASASGGNSSGCAVNPQESHDIFQLARIIAIENNKYTDIASSHATDEAMPGSAAGGGARGTSVDSTRTLSVDSTNSNGKNPLLLHCNYNMDNHKALHHWYSENGRELGFPSMRSVSISYPCKTSTLIPCTIEETSGDHLWESQPDVAYAEGMTAGDGFCSNIFASPQSTASASLHHLTEQMDSSARNKDQITTYEADTTVYHTIKSIHLNNTSNEGEHNHYNNTLQICFKYAEVEE